MASFALARQRLREFVSVLIAAAIALTARASLADHYRVPTGSMDPTVEVEDRVFVDKLAYGLRLPLTELYVARFAAPNRGDVVVLTSPENGIVLLKRVVAVGGDRIKVRDGVVEVNGQAAELDVSHGHLYETLGGKAHPLNLERSGGPDFGPVVVPRGEVLVLGDNRGNSQDGRMFGFVREASILGRAEAVFLRHGHATWLPL